jgi:predicted HicB family RNase H-like nuclease
MMGCIMVSKAKLESNDRYLQTLDDIKVRVPKGKRKVIQEFATKKGKSLNEYIVDLIEQDSGIDLKKEP